MKHLFSGGVHPAPRKELSETSSAPALQPDTVVIPLRQHIGAPCAPLVQVGDKVGVGQKIGDGEGLCVPVHASVSGTVAAVEKRPCTGGEVLSVVIRNDYCDTPASALTPHATADGLTAEQIAGICREAGIVGMGGATFPTYVKAGTEGVDTLIANACECEPYITADDTLLQHAAADVLSGLAILKTALKPGRVVLAIEDNKRAAIGVLRSALSGRSDVELRVLPTRYPQGAEKQLIRAVTGREVPSGKLPKDVGCVVFNVSTCAAIHRAVILGQPLTERIVTVTGEAVKKPQNVTVRIGTSFAQVIEAAGGLTDDAGKVIAGGPMMGVAESDLSVPVTKGTGAVLCLRRAQNDGDGQAQCIHCGKCSAACPMGLQPMYLDHYAGQQDWEELRRLHLEDCIECGCCAYVCPAKQSLVERFRNAKHAMKEVSAK